MTWLAVLLPFFGGYFFATARPLPPGCLELAGAQCASEGWRFAVVLVVMGPMCWLFAFMINDIVDLPADRLDPVRADSPLVSGRISVPAARRVVAISAALAIIGSAVAGWVFLVVTCVALLLAWAYSAPPARLKTRPGWDIFACSVTVGGLPIIAGWSLGAPIQALPVVAPVVATIHMVSVYVPTTLGDYHTDLITGNRTSAVHFGRRKTFYIGFVAMITACVIYAGSAAMNYLIPRQLFPFEVMAGIVGVAAYYLLFSKERDARWIVKGLAATGVVSVVATAVFALVYVGWM